MDQINRQFLVSLMPEISLNSEKYKFTFVDNENESYFTYSLRNSFKVRSTLDVSGQIKHLMWVENLMEWQLFTSEPRLPCEVYVSCGSFSICNKESATFCNCLTGFTPRSDTEWELNDHSGGCVRKIILQCATDNFSDVHKLGQGGFGPVYKGIFSVGQEIVVKRLSSQSRQRIDGFRNEVILISKLQHRNLVRFLGYCITGYEQIQLYEYMPNKSLDIFIFADMSPEYALEGVFSIKSDVFGLGVVILEIITRRRNTGFYQSKEASNLLVHAWNFWKEKRALHLLDHSLLESCNPKEAMKYINVGLLCVQEDPGDRPTMSDDAS
ncbi:hypothetical protein RND71_012276 [Anisodus tanguticus]|uniref:Protein kinase domain-containing protein n=1 Tax=Anisodus tanguticus TaxID=243964 RepID=A0AAE1VPM7_9SOLA|nr:hypothetical protein RND71_012276 [Anisodus tanguticus]